MLVHVQDVGDVETKSRENTSILWVPNSHDAAAMTTYMQAKAAQQHAQSRENLMLRAGKHQWHGKEDAGQPAYGLFYFMHCLS